MRLVEVIFETLENRLTRLFIALEVIAVFERLECMFLFMGKSLRHIYADIDYQVASAAAIALYGGKTFAA